MANLYRMQFAQTSLDVSWNLASDAVYVGGDITHSVHSDQWQVNIVFDQPQPVTHTTQRTFRLENQWIVPADSRRWLALDTFTVKPDLVVILYEVMWDNGLMPIGRRASSPWPGPDQMMRPPQDTTWQMSIERQLEFFRNEFAARSTRLAQIEQRLAAVERERDDLRELAERVAASSAVVGSW